MSFWLFYTVQCSRCTVSIFFYCNRLYCLNLHFNENSNRKQATTAEGNLRWAIAYPKAFKGENAVAKPLKEKPTFMVGI